MAIISKAKESDLAQRLAALGIREDDLEEHFIRASGPGGQKVNKTSSAVVLRHLPSGIEVRCQQERSQSMNRFLARRLLIEKLEEKVAGEKSARRQAIEKMRRQKRKRSRRAKEKVLETKRHQAEKKQLRKSPDL